MATILKAGRRAFLWSAGVGVAVPMALPVLLAEDHKPCCCKDSTKIRPSQLPIYDEPEDLYDVSYEMAGKGQVQEGVEVLHKQLSEAAAATQGFRDQVQHVLETGKAHTAGQINYILDEENVVARVGAIATGGLLGLLLGSRKKGGILKRVFYTSTGVGATTAALYPSLTRQYSDDVVTNANTYATVAYNFCVGVKPQNGGSGPVPQHQTPAPSSGESKQVEKEASNPEEEDPNTSAEASSGQTSKQKVSPAVPVDHGQSNPADVDMYTTRS